MVAAVKSANLIIVLVRVQTDGRQREQAEIMLLRHIQKQTNAEMQWTPNWNGHTFESLLPPQQSLKGCGSSVECLDIFGIQG
jgi:hypothetical protein